MADNIYKKLQSIRVALLDCDIKKTGENKYSGFKYYTLEDFLPECNKIMHEHGVTTIFDLDKEEAILRVVNTDNIDEAIEFKMPASAVEIKGANAIQNTGGLITYARRYLYMTVFDIAENDTFDHDMGKENVEPNKPNKPNKALGVHINTVKKKAAQLGVEDETIFKTYGLKSYDDMNMDAFNSIMKALNATEKKKKAEEKKAAEQQGTQNGGKTYE